MDKRRCVVCCLVILSLWEFGMISLAFWAWQLGYSGAGYALFVCAILAMFGSCNERCK